MIPQRPTPPAYINPNDFTGDEIHWIEDQRDHEHAVAKRAVEVLRLFEAPTGNYKRVEAEAFAALREIEQSGWEP